MVVTALLINELYSIMMAGINNWIIKKISNVRAKFESKNFLFFLFVFEIYIIVWIVFGFIYFIMYWNDPTSFAFNEKILESKSQAYKVLAKRELVELNEELVPLKKYQAELLEYKANEPQRDSWVLGLDIWKENSQRSEQQPKNDQKPVLFYGPGLDYVNERIATIESSIEYYKNKIQTVDSEVPEVWEIADFLYFSLITQTTSSYGDIMPNSRCVRILVSIQLLLSLILVVFVVAGYSTGNSEEKP